MQIPQSRQETEEELDCSQFPGRIKELCQGHDADGNPILTEKKIAAYRDWLRKQAKKKRWTAPPSENRQKIRPAGGPGTELKAIIGKFGITASPGCRCNKHAKQMDQWGADRCRQEIETILDWLEEEAKQRIMPYSRTIARQFVMLAIRRAEKKDRRKGNK